jgi:thiopurine S-methyltransferase
VILLFEMNTCKSTTAKITTSLFVWFLTPFLSASTLSSFAMSVSPTAAAVTKPSSSSSTDATAGDAAAAVAATASSSMNSEDSFNLQRWAGRWRENNLGWHRDYIHPSLQAHGDKILPILSSSLTSSSEQDETCTETAAATAATATEVTYRVFVPLCGKSLDMAYMASLDSVSQVVGLDGIEKALLEFVQENPQLEIIPPAKRNMDDDDDDDDELKEKDKSVAIPEDATTPSSSSFRYWNGKKIQLLQGDFFALDSNSTSGRFQAIYDRAAMVAIEPALRRDYVTVMGRLILPGGKILLVTIERDDETAGPPFSVTLSHVQEIYETQDWVESITALEGGRDADDRFVEGIYLIQAKK